MFALFDHLVVFSREGTIMYQGSPRALQSSFARVGLRWPLYSNMSDFLLEVASGDFGFDSVRQLAHYTKESNRYRIGEETNEVSAISLQEAVKRSYQISVVNNR